MIEVKKGRGTTFEEAHSLSVERHLESAAGFGRQTDYCSDNIRLHSTDDARGGQEWRKGS